MSRHFTSCNIDVSQKSATERRKLLDLYGSIYFQRGQGYFNLGLYGSLNFWTLQGYLRLYRKDKEDSDLMTEHKDRVPKALEESNLTGFLVPLYENFPATISELFKELISTALPLLEVHHTVSDGGNCIK